MDAENFSLDDSSDTKIIEDFSAILPGISISVLSNGLIVKAVHGGDLPGLVVSSQKGDVSWILQFEAQQKLESLDGVESSVNEVTHEDVSGVWDFTALVEKFQKIMELAMDISANCNGGLDWLDVALFNEDLLYFLTEDSKFSFWQDGTVLDGLEPIINNVLSHFFLSHLKIYFI